MMKNKTEDKIKFEENYYVKVWNIHWNEGPKYRGQKEFWFMITPSQYKSYGDDPIHKMALSQEIENLLPQAGKYAGICPNELECEIWDYKEIRETFPRYSIEAVDLTEYAVENMHKRFKDLSLD